jgi:hypothetical protein
MKEHGDVIAEGILTSASDSPLVGVWNREGCQRDLGEREGMAVSLGGALSSEAWWGSMGLLLLARRLACWVSRCSTSGAKWRRRSAFIPGSI